MSTVSRVTFGGVGDAATIEYGSDFSRFFEPHGEIACPVENPATS